MMFRCFSCRPEAEGVTGTFTDTVHHRIAEHADAPIEVEEELHMFDVIPNDVSGFEIKVDEADMTLLLIPLEIGHGHTNETPSKKIRLEGADSGPVPEDESDDNIVKTFLNAVPYLQDNGCLDNMMSFFSLVGKEQFPLENIAFKLFLDVVRWYTKPSTVAMRYSPEVKLFWKTGQMLFHGKFIRYMAGIRNRGQVVSGTTRQGSYDPNSSRINFAVPGIDYLTADDDILPAKDIKPGLLIPMMEQLRSSTEASTFKMCLDGKKINPSSLDPLGEVNLFGFEDSPTSAERSIQLETEKQKILSVCDAYCSAEQIIEVLQILSVRLKSLREVKVKKTNLKMRLLDAATSINKDWRKTKLSLVISAVHALLYRIDTTMNGILSHIDKLSLICCAKQDTAHLFIEEPAIDLGSSVNFLCLQGEPTGTHVVAPLTKQRTDAWYTLRQQAFVTGSTLHRAIGLESFKAQIKHFDRFFLGKKTEEPGPDLQSLFAHGVANELHAVGTLVGKILPLLEPDLIFCEEGCYPLVHDGLKIVVSPDGSGRKSPDSPASVAIEIKCPFPGKQFKTDLQYQVPWYYVVQLLAEMTALGTKSLMFVSYTKESTAVHRVRYDKVLWDDIVHEANILYGSDSPKRPVKLSPAVNEIRERLKRFSLENTSFELEVPSLWAHDCVHIPKDVGGEQRRAQHTACAKHDGQEQLDCSNDSTMQSSRADLTVPLNTLLDEAAIATRPRATELLIFMMSDLNRAFKAEIPHALPVAYGMCGSSIRVETVREMLHHVISKARSLGLRTIVCSSNGQFCRIAVRNKDGAPLTMLQLQKDVFFKAKKTKKADIMKQLSKLTAGKDRQVHLNKAVLDILRNKSTKRPTAVVVVEEDALDDERQSIRDELLQLLPEDNTGGNSTGEELVCAIADILPSTAAPAIDEDCVDDVHILFADQGEHVSEASNPPESSQGRNCEDLPVLLRLLQSSTKCKAKWKELTENDFKDLLTNAQSVNAAFTAPELRVCLSAMKESIIKKKMKYRADMRKCELSNLFAKLYCSQPHTDVEGSRCNQRKHNPKALKSLCVAKIDKLFPKDALNIIYAGQIYPSELAHWKDSNVIPNRVQVDGCPCPIEWASQPDWSKEEDDIMFFIMDSEHMLVNMRVKCCSSGMPAAGVFRESFVRVAKNCAENKTGLNLSLVEDIVDKQKCAFALTTFSEDVAQAMDKNGDLSTARFVRIFRRWYDAEDCPSLSARERIERRLDLRSWLLEDVNMDEFPAPGGYVKDIPITMFEGLITSIERRLQLYAFVEGGCYNVRAVSSLDAENLFSEFQDFDPRGQGILAPRDVPIALSKACQLIHTRLRPDRTFYMCTTKKKVYPEHEVMDFITGSGTKEMIISGVQQLRELCHTNMIYAKDHAFDADDRSRGKRKKREAYISMPESAAKGAQTLRTMRYRTNEARIPAHIRIGIPGPSSEN